MNQFFNVFKKIQQFLLLQAYADEIMTDDELMTFLLNETNDERFCFISQNGLYVVIPNVSLDDFTHSYFSPPEVQISMEKSTIYLKVPKEVLQLPFSKKEDAQNILSDIDYLWSN